MSVKQLIGARIRERRLVLGIRQADLARSVGISASYLNLIEHNRRRIAGKLLIDLAHELGVEAAALAEGAEASQIESLRRAAARFPSVDTEDLRIDDMAQRFPGWSALVVQQDRQIDALEAQVKSMSDRMAHDPVLAAALHDVLSSVTSIRSTASILVGDSDVDADWQKRFHTNIHTDSQRLAESSQALATYLEPSGQDRRNVLSVLEDAEYFWKMNDFHFPDLENLSDTEIGPQIDEIVQRANASHALRQVLEVQLKVYAQDARALPLEALDHFIEGNGLSPSAIALEFGAPLDVVLRRIAVLPDKPGRTHRGLVITDSAGDIRFLKPVGGFEFSRAGGTCPLWPVHRAMQSPNVPVVANLALPGDPQEKFTVYAISVPMGQSRFEEWPIFRNTMLLIADGGIAPVIVEGGLSCRICVRSDCATRREPSILGLSS